MRVFLTLLVIPVVSFGFYTVKTESLDSGKVVLEMRVNPSEIKMTQTKWGPNNFTKIEHSEGKGDPGSPEIPTIHKWIAIEEGVEYETHVTVADPKVFDRILLHPTQPDRLENSQPTFTMNESAYLQRTAFGGESAIVGDTLMLGPIKVAPIAITPIQYNAAARELTVYQSLRIELTPKGEVKRSSRPRLTRFIAAQVRALVSNAQKVLKGHSKKVDQKLLIAAPKSLMSYAQQLGSSKKKQGVQVSYVEIPSGTTSTNLQSLLKTQHASLDLDAVLLFGDEKTIPLYKSADSILGDVFYSFVSGSDQVSDISVGRLPVSDAVEAQLIVNKIKKHRQMQVAGQLTKNVMLLAHNEDYPGKYTANQEQVRKAANPKGLNYEVQYGGNQSTNAGVNSSIEAKPFAIVNYRGHGSDSAWYAWDANDKNFGFSEVDALPDDPARLAIYFNVACDNGAIQRDADTLVEKQLFPKRGDTYRGAVATFGATEPSYTETNHRFNVNLFKYLQESTDSSFGNIYTLANNKLTQDNGGTAPANVKMYILFSDPLLRPLTEK